MKIIEGAGTYTTPVCVPNHFVEHLRVPDLSVGTYSLPAGSIDNQSPHTEDEIYLVCRGRGILVSDGATIEVGPGSVVYVPAGEAHRFTDVIEDLAVLVLFAPPYQSRSS